VAGDCHKPALAVNRFAKLPYLIEQDIRRAELEIRAFSSLWRVTSARTAPYDPH
jgi:hypothetical protein